MGKRIGSAACPFGRRLPLSPLALSWPARWPLSGLEHSVRLSSTAAEIGRAALGDAEQLAQVVDYRLEDPGLSATFGPDGGRPPMGADR